MVVFFRTRRHRRARLIIAACDIAQGRQLALAPRVLCELYRGLGLKASFEKGPLARHLFFPAHYLSAWLGVYFPWTFGLSHIDDVPSGEILLRRFSNCNMANLTFSTVTGRLLTSFSLSQGMYRLPCGSLKEDIIKKAHEELSREEIEFIMAQVPGLLPS